MCLPATSAEVSQELLDLTVLLYMFLFTVGLTTATLHWLEWPMFTFANFSLYRTWLLVWCLECAEVNTSPQFLKAYPGYLLVSEFSRRHWWSGSVFMVSLQLISATSAYPLLPSRVVSICDVQRLALCWFHAPRLQLDNEISQSTDQPHGTVCHQHYDHRTCRRAPSSGH